MLRSRLWLCAPAVALLAGCASNPSGSATGVSPVSTGIAGGGNLRINGKDPSTVRTIRDAPEQVWRALPAAFDSLGIPVANLDAKKRMIGNEAFKIRGRLKNVPLSRYIDCGTSTQIGPNADSYEVNLTLMAEVKSGEGGTTSLITTFAAVARPANFAQSYSQCSTRGTLEARFVDLVNAQLKR